MQSLKKTWFISDLHLDPDHPEISFQFIKLLQSSNESVDDIYILGDLFEAWIGDDDSTPFNESIIAAIKDAVLRGTRIHIMHGNRDFLIGKNFLEKSRSTLLDEEEKIDVYGTPVLLMHGDTLCTKDVSYLRARKMMRSRILQSIFLFLPISFRKKLAHQARSESQKYTSTAKPDIMDVSQSEVERVMQKHGIDYLIHGHTHKPSVHQFDVGDKTKNRIVLPAWHDGGTVFEWASDGKRQYIKL